MRRVDLRFVAKVIVDMMYNGGKVQAARMNGISVKTVSRYARRFEDCGPDSELSALVLQLLEKKDDHWSRKIDPAIASGIDFLNRAFVEADPSRADVIREVSHAVAMLSESQLTKQIVAERLRAASPSPPQYAEVD